MGDDGGEYDIPGSVPMEHLDQDGAPDETIAQMVEVEIEREEVIPPVQKMERNDY